VKSLCFPEQVAPLQPERILKIACGANHCLAVTVDGEVFQWGAMSRFLETREEYFGSKVKMPGMSELNKTRQDLVRESHEKYTLFVISFR
jgi:alpha-tubulin suppressor-like RCC1 family protein